MKLSCVNIVCESTLRSELNAFEIHLILPDRRLWLTSAEYHFQWSRVVQTLDERQSSQTERKALRLGKIRLTKC